MGAYFYFQTVTLCDGLWTFTEGKEENEGCSNPLFSNLLVKNCRKGGKSQREATSLSFDSKPPFGLSPCGHVVQLLSKTSLQAFLLRTLRRTSR